MGQFDQFANQGGAAAWDPSETAEAKRVAEEQLKNADYSGGLPEPLGQGASASPESDARFSEPAPSSEALTASTDDAGN